MSPEVLMPISISVDKADLLNMIKGTGGPIGYLGYQKFSYVGVLGNNERWEWNMLALNNMSGVQLYNVYKELKEFNKDWY